MANCDELIAKEVKRIRLELASLNKELSLIFKALTKEKMEHIVEFDKYCSTCKHRDLDESSDICNTCLYSPVNEDSRKPINYKKDVTSSNNKGD